MKYLIRIILLLTPAFALAGEPSDLGNNLAYLRVHSLADSTAELKTALALKHAYVLDVRYATATDEAIAALKSALAAHPPEVPLFILISPATPSGVIDAISAPTRSKFITLGIAGTQPAPRIEVRTLPEIDRSAYDALDHGKSLNELVSGKIEKDRYDEATLVHEFKNGNPDPESALSPDATKSKPTNGADKADNAADPAEPLRDRVLQRALNLHQALLALRR